MIDVIQERLGEIIGFSTADETESLIAISDESLTRFANNVIHQNTSRKDITVLIRVIIGKKIGITNLNKIDSGSLKKAVNKAIIIAKAAPERTDFYGLSPDTSPQYKIKRCDSKTSNLSPLKKADIIKELTKKANGLNASGSIENAVQILGIANSKGINKTQAMTEAKLNLVVSSKSGSGYGSAVQTSVDGIDFMKITDKAIEKATKSENPIEIKPGKYTVFLEPYAVSEMVSLLSYSGMGALSVQEGRSFLCGKLGQKIVNEKITIYDDASDERAIGFGFDYEGITRQKMTIIDKGVAVSPVYDSNTAAKEGKKSTGHALPASTSFGPLPLNLVLREGKKTPGELIKGIEKGIYITRYHYTNLEHPVKTIFTGMTRDGTFLIENGKITKPLRNLRFTQSIIDALNNVEDIGNDTSVVDSMTGAYLVPSLVINNFNFTSVTEF